MYPSIVVHGVKGTNVGFRARPMSRRAAMTISTSPIVCPLSNLESVEVEGLDRGSDQHTAGVF